MEQTRDAVIRLLQERGSSTAADLATEVGVSTGSIRRHMDIMVAEGLLETELVRQQRGRPVTRYSLSEAGEEETSGARYSRLLERIYPALSGMGSDEVSGLDGAELMNLIFDRVGESVAREHAPRVTAELFDERVQQVTAVLHEEGILELVEQRDDLVVLRNTTCPVRSCAEGNHAMCDADRGAIEALLGLPVVQASTMASGGDACEYVVRRPLARPASGVSLRG
ncbi:MAG: winged helix-turn-helix transcriptional regulator [Chloroflexi bacterium]|nr:winged helix-turn-helix transcriptional regulator [Chloroflexota bacterium]MDA1145112.1 winged helix-turn-helix transcriptional regulator [Chloroflexota bacterium]